jgi:hypothetical protein
MLICLDPLIFDMLICLGERDGERELLQRRRVWRKGKKRKKMNLKVKVREGVKVNAKVKRKRTSRKKNRRKKA